MRNNTGSRGLNNPKHQLEKSTVVVINCYLQHGGVERQIRYLLESPMFSETFSPVIIYFGPPQQEFENWHGVKVLYCPWKFGEQAGWRKILHFPSFLFRCMHLVRAERARIIHTFGPFENLTAAAVSFLSGIPYIASVRTTISWAFKFLRLWGPRSSRIISNSEAALNILYDLKPSLSSKSLIVRNGIDLLMFPFIDTVPYERNKELRVLLLGRVSRSKNQILALKAIKILVDSGYLNGSLSVTIAGPVENSAYAYEIEDFVKSNHLESIVNLRLGHVDSVSMYRLSDVLLLTSQSEGLANVLIEAMAVGLPWIASDVADARFLAGPNCTRGILFPANDVQALAESLRRFYHADFLEVSRQIHEAQTFIVAELGLEKMITKTIEIYREVMAK